MHFSLLRRAAAATFVALAWAETAGAEVVVVGAEIQINSVPAGGDAIPALAAFENGDFVVTWSENVDFPGPSNRPLRAEVMARRFSSAGVAFEAEFVVNTYTTGWQGFPAVDAWEDGFVVVWESDPNNFRDPQFGALRLYDRTGVPTSDEIRFADVANDPIVAADLRGGFAIAWMGRADSYLQRFERDGTPLGGPVPTGFGSYVTGVAVLMDRTVVAVSSRGCTTARLFDHIGAPRGDGFVVNQLRTGVAHAEVVSDPGGGFVVLWTQFSGRDRNIVGRRFGPDGAAAGDEFQIAGGASLGADLPTQRPLAIGPSGEVVVVWVQPDGRNSAIATRHLDSSGQVFGTPILINTMTGEHIFPSVAADRSGGFIAVWRNFVTSSPFLEAPLYGRRLSVVPGPALTQPRVGWPARGTATETGGSKRRS